MKKFIKAIFSHHCALIRAAWEMQRAKSEARRKYKKSGHRFFCIWNPQRKRLETLTYDAYPFRRDSYKYLRRRGKFQPLTRRQFKEGAFYYTGSRHGAKEMPSSQIYRSLEILRRRYYTDHQPN